MSSQDDNAPPMEGRQGEAASLSPGQIPMIPALVPVFQYHYRMFLLHGGLQELRDEFVHEMHPALRDLFDEVMECVEECACRA